MLNLHSEMKQNSFCYFVKDHAQLNILSKLNLILSGVDSGITRPFLSVFFEPVAYLFMLFRIYIIMSTSGRAGSIIVAIIAVIIIVAILIFLVNVLAPIIVGIIIILIIAAVAYWIYQQMRRST